MGEIIRAEATPPGGLVPVYVVGKTRIPVEIALNPTRYHESRHPKCHRHAPIRETLAVVFRPHLQRLSDGIKSLLFSKGSASGKVHISLTSPYSHAKNLPPDVETPSPLSERLSENL
jgi:hypothetical protein